MAVGVMLMLLSCVLFSVARSAFLGGYMGGKVETILTTITDVMLAFPPIVFLLTLRSVLVNPDEGRQFTIPKLVLILGILAIPGFYRQTRAQTLARRSAGYVLSAEALGARRGWILFRELAPNVALPVVSIGFVVMAGLLSPKGRSACWGSACPNRSRAGEK